MHLDKIETSRSIINLPCPDMVIFLVRNGANIFAQQKERWQIKEEVFSHFTAQCVDYFYFQACIQPAYGVGPPSARQRNAIQMAFHWGPIVARF